jgi:hypothetical protein
MWYGSWMTGGRRVRRRLGRPWPPGTSDGVTRNQGELRRRMAEEVVGVAPERRRTIEDYRCHLRRHLVPFFGGRSLDRIRPAEPHPA